MKVKLLTPEEALIAGATLLAFAGRFGDSRLTASALRELRRLSEAAAQPGGEQGRLLQDAAGAASPGNDAQPARLAMPAAGPPASGAPSPHAAHGGDAAEPFTRLSSASTHAEAVAVAHEGGKLAAFAFAADAGERACFVVVRPEWRGRGIGSELLRALHGRFGRLTCSVAADNPASMQMCFRAGMKAVGLSAGPTGKPTLRFEC